MSSISPLHSTFRKLFQVETVVWNRLDDRLRERHGLSLAHVTVLRVIEETPGCRVQDVVTTLDITVGGASKSVDRLEAAGHAVRAAHPTDRRSSVLLVTDAGRAVLDLVAPDVEALLDDWLGTAISAEDLAHLDRILTAVQSHAWGRRP
jgi:DNA-binding MarR family transcriptional regulator